MTNLKLNLLIFFTSWSLFLGCNGSSFNQKPGGKQAIELGTGEQLGEEKSSAEEAKNSRSNDETLVPGSEPIDVSGAFLAGGFVQKNNGITTIGYDVFSDKDFKTKHDPAAKDDLLRPTLPSHMSIGRYDAVTGIFKPLKSSATIKLNSPLNAEYTYGFEVAEDIAHLLTLKYDDGTQLKFKPVNNPTVFPVSAINFQIAFGYRQKPENYYAISTSTSVTTAVSPQKFPTTDPKFNQDIKITATQNNMFQIANPYGYALGVLPNSENNTADLTMINSAIAALPGGASLPKILQFGAIQTPGVSEDHKTMYLKLGSLYTRSDYYICGFNVYTKGSSGAGKADMYIAIPTSVLSTAEAYKYLIYCDRYGASVNPINPEPPSTWVTNFEWW